jgi:putative transposase
MIKAFVYRLYPTKTQIKSLEETLTTCRYWYNTCLAERKEAYETEKKTITKVEQLRKVKELKASNPYAAKAHSHVLQNVVQDLDKAFKAFFRRLKAGETPGYPRFKGRNRWKSFGFKEYGNGFKIDGRRLRLFGVGRVSVRWHRPIEGKIKTVRIVKKAGLWYACFACEVEPNLLPSTGKEVAIDVGITSLITTSDGDKVKNPRWYRNQQRKLRVLQRRVARRKLGSYNRRKAVLALQKQHQHIANSRKDFLDKLVYKLITHYDRIALEDLRIPNMVKNRQLSKSILDAGWGYLIQRLLDKAEEAGRVVSLVNPAFTSKMCSACGYIFEHLSLKDRWINCDCGFSGCRDWNASLNLLRLGRSLWEDAVSEVASETLAVRDLSSTVVGLS